MLRIGGEAQREDHNLRIAPWPLGAPKGCKVDGVRVSPGVGSPRQKALFILERRCRRQETKAKAREAWRLGVRGARARPSLTFDQGMLVCGGGASQHSQLWPDLVDSLLLNLERDAGGGGLVRLGRETEARRREGNRQESRGSGHAGWLPWGHAAPVPPCPPHPSKDPLLRATYLPLLVADPAVELLALQAQEVLPRMDDATFDGNGPGCVDIVTGDHPDCDACPLALSDGFWDLDGRAEAMVGGSHFGQALPALVGSRVSPAHRWGCQGPRGPGDTDGTWATSALPVPVAGIVNASQHPLTKA